MQIFCKDIKKATDYTDLHGFYQILREKFGGLAENIYFCPRLLTIKTIIAYRNIYTSELTNRSMSTLKEMSDEQLALLYADGNNRAFDELLYRIQDKLFTYIICMVKDEELANDLFQETFVKVIVKLRNGLYKDSGKFAYWVNRIAHNVVIDHYREQKNLRIIETPKTQNLQNLKSASILESDREHSMVNEQVMEDVKRLMDALPATQREVVWMRYFEEMSFKEIAQATGVSINTSLGRMRYALINMRKLSKEHGVNLNLI